MNYDSALVTGRLIKRYKRFLADVELDSGELITAHCANTGAMTHCAEPGSRVWLWDSANPKRKYRYSWEWVEIFERHKACINTARANRLVEEAIAHQNIGKLSGYANLETEPRVEDGRLDFFLSGHTTQPDAWVEVKSVTLARPDLRAGLACFPDAKTDRGLKHLNRLIELKQSGRRAVLVFATMLEGVTQVAPAFDVHPAYADTLKVAVEAGVEVMALQCVFQDAFQCAAEQYGMELVGELPVVSNAD